MKIFNIRDGFANNSSSTHSIIFTDKPTAISDDYDPTDFGWEYFTIASKQGVLEYLRATLYSHMKYNVHPDYVECIIDNWVGHNFKWSDDEYNNPIVDHQSLIALPLVFDESAIDKRFFDELKQLFLNSDVLILGGNDNDNQIHPHIGTPGVHATFLTECGSLIAKKDINYWTLFDRHRGTKYRVKFNNHGTENVLPTSASSPDLCDVKITDFCNFGCTYCLTPGSLITTNNGVKPIEQISVGDIVATFNTETLCVEYFPVDQLFEREYDDDIITIELADGSIHNITPNHEVYTTNRGWVDAGDLTEDDDVISIYS